MQKKIYSTEVGGQTLTAEFNDLAEQANGSVIVRLGDTAILATAVMSKHSNDGVGYFPLTVDYEERFYAVGAILGSRFLRREGRPSDDAILSGRIVDRTIRPLFDSWIRHDIQVVLTVLSVGEYDPDVLGVIAASLALGTSDIPWNGPVSAIRIAETADARRIDAKERGKGTDTINFLINPTYAEREGNKLDLLACGKDGKINMIEVGSYEVTEDVIVEGLKKASEEIEKIQKWQQEIISERGKEKKVIEAPVVPQELKDLFAKEIEARMDEFIFCGPGKAKINQLKDIWMDLFRGAFPDGDTSVAGEYFEEKLNDIIHREAIENERRPDGRKLNELRPLYAQAGGVSPILHGSGIFYRGGTHILSVLTLGGPGDSQVIDNMELQDAKKHFLHHYNFPPYSTGETGRIGGMNRRMTGHGALAEKALVPIIPPKEIFPYTIRIVSESMASNGSTSMGSVCGSTLALMDAGVPIKAPVAGIASGLMMNEKGDFKVLTDIQGPEDHHGDMDFKVAGTRNGVTAIQMDVKVLGVTIEMLTEALARAKDARFQILDVIEKEIAKPRETISPNAPEIKMLKIKVDQIGLVIGSGGKTVNEIKNQTGTEIDIEDDGTVFVTGKNGSAQKAIDLIAALTKEFVVGEKVEGTVMKITDFGAFVNIGNQDGLVHVSEFAPFRVNKVSDLVKVGDKVPVVVKAIDDMGRLKLSIKDRDPKFFDSKKK